MLWLSVADEAGTPGRRTEIYCSECYMAWVGEGKLWRRCVYKVLIVGKGKKIYIRYMDIDTHKHTFIYRYVRVCV